MNRRQAKKKFKKQYNCTPEKVAVIFSSTLEETFLKIEETLKMFKEQFINTVNDIQTMPIEEFERKIESLNNDQKKLAWKIRFSKKGE